MILTINKMINVTGSSSWSRMLKDQITRESYMTEVDLIVPAPHRQPPETSSSSSSDHSHSSLITYLRSSTFLPGGRVSTMSSPPLKGLSNNGMFLSE